MEEIIQKLTDFVGYVAGWFDSNILTGFFGFLRELGELMIKILEFLVQIIQWLISKI